MAWQMRLSPSDKIFCNSPWYELHVYWDGALSFCCHASPKVPYSTTDRLTYNIKNMSIAEWYQSIPMQQARKQLLSDQHWDFCDRCYKEESTCGSSRRHRSNQKSAIFVENFQQSFTQSPGYTKFIDPEFSGVPVELHIDLGNYCNLACKMCGPTASSKIAAQHRVWGLPTQVQQDWTQDQVTWDRFLAEIVSIPKLQNVHFMGGETLIQPRFEEFVDCLLANNRTDVCISFVTNGTVFNNQLFQKLKKFPRLGFEVSIESLSDSNGYTRQGTDTNQVITNIDKFIEECNNTSITLILRPAPSALTVRDFWQVIKLALDKKLVIRSNLCISPEFMQIEVLPFTIRQKYLDKYTQLLADYNLGDEYSIRDFNESDPNNYRLIAKKQILQIIHLLSSPDCNNQRILLEQLVAHLTKWDKVYNYNAREIYPELDYILTECGYDV